MKKYRGAVIGAGIAFVLVALDYWLLFYSNCFVCGWLNIDYCHYPSCSVYEYGTMSLFPYLLVFGSILTMLPYDFSFDINFVHATAAVLFILIGATVGHLLQKMVRARKALAAPTPGVQR